MSCLPKVNPSTYYLGVNDRTKQLFENLWPLPQGVAYNSYLIRDEKNVLIDTVDVCYSENFFRKLEDALDGNPLHYLVVNHMEPDHSGSIELLRNKYPDIEIVGNKKTLEMLDGYYGIASGCIAITEKDELNIGSRALRFIFAPMVHWPEVMFTYDPAEKTIFSADAFGSYGTVDGGILDSQLDTAPYLQESYRYYSNIVGKYGSFTQKAMKKLAEYDVETICATHGPIWREQKEQVLALYDKMSRYEAEEGVVIAYGSMYGHTEEVAETIGRTLGACGIRNVVLHNLSKSHISFVLADFFKYKGVILGAPTYNNALFPHTSALLEAIAGRGITNRLYGCFGSFSWASAATKRLVAFGEEMKWESIAAPFDVKMQMSLDHEQAAQALGEAMAEALQR